MVFVLLLVGFIFISLMLAAARERLLLTSANTVMDSEDVGMPFHVFCIIKC